MYYFDADGNAVWVDDDNVFGGGSQGPPPPATGPGTADEYENNPPPATGGGDGNGGGGTPAPAPGQAAYDWWLEHAPNPSDFGAVPAPFGETYSTLARPSWLQGEFVAPTWSEKFVAPDAAALYADPGYQARLEASQRTFERSAAAKGSILSGGFVGRTLPRAQQDLASQEYGSAFQRAYDTYQSRYGEFSDAAARQYGARTLNETAYQGDVGSHLNQFQTRYKSYQDEVENKRKAEEDRWKRAYETASLGLTAFLGGKPA